MPQGFFKPEVYFIDDKWFQIIGADEILFGEIISDESAMMMNYTYQEIYHSSINLKLKIEVISESSTQLHNAVYFK